MYPRVPKNVACNARFAPADSPDVLNAFEAPCQPVRTEAFCMSVARITEISSTSSQSFEDAIKQGLDRASKTLRGIRSAWIKEQTVDLKDGTISGYRVNMLVTFVLEE